MRNRIYQYLKPQRFGYRRLTVLLRREGWAVNHKRVYRLYREAGLVCGGGSTSGSAEVERQALEIPTG